MCVRDCRGCDLCIPYCTEEGPTFHCLTMTDIPFEVALQDGEDSNAFQDWLTATFIPGSYLTEGECPKYRPIEDEA